MDGLELTFSKGELLETLKENRGKHQSIFEEAQEGYRKKIIAIFEERLAAAKEGKKVSHFVSLQEPMNQTGDYDRVIRMLEMSKDDEITLDEGQFTQYVMDQWDWRGGFLNTNAAYSLSAKTELDS
jgi:hypothetical protein